MIKHNITPTLIVDSSCKVGESLIYSQLYHRLYWVDITQKQLHTYHIITNKHQMFDTPEMIGCIVEDNQGHLIASGEQHIYKIVINYNNINDIIFIILTTITTHTDIKNIGMRSNDGRCDRQGRFLISTMMRNQALNQGNPSLYRFNDTLTRLTTLTHLFNLNSIINPFTTPNGMAFSPNGRTFYLSDTHKTQQTVWQFDYDTIEGIPYNPRLFIDMNKHEGRPDGATIDTDGCYWVCATDAGLIHRFTPKGILDYSLKLPVKKPTICTFGGIDLRILYVASLCPDNNTDTYAGAVFAFEGLNVQGISETLFTLIK